MNLAFAIFKYYPFGGLERNFLRITEECLARGHSIRIFTMKWNGDIPEALRKGKCEIVEMPCSNLTNHARCASFASKLSDVLRKNEFDLVVGFNRMPGLDLYYCADVCYVADVRQRRSLLHRFTPRYKTYASFEKAVFSPESRTMILALSRIQQEIYMREYGTPGERFLPIPAGIDKAFIRSHLSEDGRKRCRSELSLDDGETMLLMIGSDFHRKGVDRSIKALASLPPSARGRNTRLLIAGKGRSGTLKRLAKSLDVGNSVEFLGAVDDVSKLLAAADALLHPARAENTGNAIVEALIAGVPVMTLSNCGYAFHVEKAGAGVVMDGWNFSQEEMNAKLAEFLTEMPEKRSEWRKSAWEYSDKTDFHSRPLVVADIIERMSNSQCGVF